MEEVKALLAKCPVLSGLPEKGLSEAAQIAKVRCFDEKALICNKGGTSIFSYGHCTGCRTN